MTLSTSPTEAMQPVTSGDRIPALDITRGVAVLGILLMNIWSFGWPKEVFDYPVILSHMDGATVETWAVVHGLFEGSQRALFSLLFGAGTLMLLQRLEQKNTPRDVKKLYRRRIMFLILFGLTDAYIFLWPADILYVYGLCGFLLFYLRHMKVRSLAILTLLVFSVPTIIRSIEYQNTTHLMQSQNPQDITAWQEDLHKARPDFNDVAFQKSLAIMQDGPLIEVVKKQATGSLILQTIVTVKWWLMDALGAMLVGMMLYKSGLLTLQCSKAVYWRLLFLGYGIGIPVSTWETLSLITSDFHPLQQALTAFTYDLGRMAMALGHLTLILLFCQSQSNILGVAALKKSLAAVGQMALSNYLGQSLLCGVIFYSYGFGLYGKLPGYQLYGVVLALWVVEIIWSRIWLSHYRFGPFEWLWRSLTYGKKQPMR